MTHRELVERAVRWLRSHHRCRVVLAEIHSAAGERPDAIGWKSVCQCVLVECKTSRSDFLVDARKTGRRLPEMQLGHERWYFVADPTIATPEEVHARGFGLAVVDGRSVKRVLKAPSHNAGDWGSGARREVSLLVSVLARYQAQGLSYKPLPQAPPFIPASGRPV